MSDNLEMPKTFAELEAYTSRILASQQAAHDAEIARLKEEVVKLHNAHVELERSYIERLFVVNAACAMKDEALKTCIVVPCVDSLCGLQMFNEPMVASALSASPQHVSEWERKQLAEAEQRGAIKALEDAAERCESVRDYSIGRVIAEHFAKVVRATSKKAG